MNHGYNVRLSAIRSDRMEQSADMWERIRQERAAISEKNVLRVRSAISALKVVDPQGWEAWYDSDAVPEFDLHDTEAVNRALDIINKRAVELVVIVPEYVPSASD